MGHHHPPIVSRRQILGYLSGVVGALAWLGLGAPRRAAAAVGDAGVRIDPRIPEHALPRPARYVTARPHPDGLALYRRGRNRPFVRLNGPAADIWRLCDGTRRPKELAAELVGIYDVSPARAYADCLLLLGQLRHRDAIRL